LLFFEVPAKVSLI